MKLFLSFCSLGRPLSGRLDGVTIVKGKSHGKVPTVTTTSKPFIF
jgi:hypothetical protein